MSGKRSCICTAELFDDAPGQDIYTINRDPMCPHHGDGTPHWAKVVAFAKDLATRLNADESMPDSGRAMSGNSSCVCGHSAEDHHRSWLPGGGVMVEECEAFGYNETGGMKFVGGRWVEHCQMFRPSHSGRVDS